MKSPLASTGGRRGSARARRAHGPTEAAAREGRGRVSSRGGTAAAGVETVLMWP
jgi:hypothetical protein